MGERLLDGQNLRELRSMLDANLSHECDVQTNSTPNPNASGGVVPTWVSQTFPLTPCQLSPSGQASLQNRADQDRSIGLWRVRFAAGTVVTEANRLVVSGENNGVAFSRKLIPMAIQPSNVSTIVYARDASPAEAK